jgi:hypothetical protein
MGESGNPREVAGDLGPICEEPDRLMAPEVEGRCGGAPGVPGRSG